ncbi:MAG: hypothetical protein HQL34_06285 [Alphaproteobacteria bacterium]|nr:hypothetical protein [Alphaproteobacteria bacterium]
MRTFFVGFVISFVAATSVSAQQNSTAPASSVSMEVGRHASGIAADAARPATAGAVDASRKEAAKAAEAMEKSIPTDQPGSTPAAKEK